MRVLILHDAVTKDDAPDAADVLVQAAAVRAALRALGHETVVRSCDTDLKHLGKEIASTGADLVFNLVESLEGKGRLIHLVPAYLEAKGIPFTGTGSLGMLFTSHKPTAKKRMIEAGIPTPRQFDPETDASLPGTGKLEWIIKSAWEHASIGLDDGALVLGTSGPALRRLIRERSGRLGGEAFAEVYIPGREFNLSILAGNRGPEVLPVAEIRFDRMAEGKPRIVGYAAKWDDTSAEAEHTERVFPDPGADTLLHARLKQVALACWTCFGLKGYARVDFRVDTAGRLFVLEVNANPCISPDGGFAAALARAGIPFDEAVRRIVREALPAHACRQLSEPLMKLKVPHVSHTPHLR